MISGLLYGMLAVLLFTGCRKHLSSGKPVPVEDVTETALLVQTAVPLDGNATIKGFYQALPGHYGETTKNYPLLVFIHGGGQFGNGKTDLSLLQNDGVAQLIAVHKFPPDFTVNGKHFSFIVLNPQFERYPATKDIEDFIRYAKRNYRVDTTRIYLSGLSMGGFVASQMGGEYPYELAAIVPVAGVIDDLEVCSRIAASHLPVWAFHNREDPTINIAVVEHAISVINSFKPVLPPKLTIFNAAVHDAWTVALQPTYKENGMNVYEWMLQYSR